MCSQRRRASIAAHAAHCPSCQLIIACGNMVEGFPSCFQQLLISAGLVRVWSTRIILTAHFGFSAIRGARVTLPGATVDRIASPRPISAWNSCDMIAPASALAD